MAGNQSNRNRGFAAMGVDQQREIAARGGREAHRQGHAHEFDSEEAREAGRLGGRAISRDRAHMAEIGARGGHARRRDNDNHQGGIQRGGQPSNSLDIEDRDQIHNR